MSLAQPKLYLQLDSQVMRVALSAEKMVTAPSVALAKAHDDSEVVSVGDRALRAQGLKSDSMQLLMLLERGIPRYTTQTTAAISQLLQELLGSKSALVPRQNHYCCIPSTATPVERSIFQQVLRPLGVGSWQLVSMGELLSRAASRHSGASLGGAIALLTDMTEVVIGDKGGENVAHAIPIGVRDITTALSQWLQSEYQVVVSQSALNTILDSLPPGLLSQESHQGSGYKLAIRAKDTRSGKPTTSTIDLTGVMPLLQEIVRSLASEITAIFAASAIESVTPSLERGMLLTGVGSSIPGIAPALTQHVQVRLVQSQTPEHDVITSMLELA